MNDPFEYLNGGTDDIYGIPFVNKYMGQHWSHGGKWGVAAKKAGIKVDDIPLPGDAVYFNEDGNIYGHIAWVKSVEYDNDMNWKSILVAEYNIKHEQYGTRTITKGQGGDFINKPKGFIHVLATKNPEFYFNYYDLGYDFAGQTKEAWEYIYALVMSNYYDGSSSKYTASLNQALTSIGGYLPGGFGGIGGGYIPPSADYNSDGSGAVEKPQSGESDHEGYKHNVSMDDVEATIAGQDDYHHSFGFYYGDVPASHVRARLKNKRVVVMIKGHSLDKRLKVC